MANAQRGEAPYIYQGAEYTLKLSVGAIASMETAYKPFGVVCNELQQGGVSAMCHALAAGTTPKISFDEACDMVEAEGYEYFAVPVLKALELCMVLKRTGAEKKQNATA